METNMKPSGRLMSLDALRGFDMLFIMGGAEVLIALAALFPNSFFQALAGQMRHVHWDGFTFYDMIFPLFLFIAGISFPFSLDKQHRNGISPKTIHLHILKRGVVLVLLGCIYNGLLNFDFEHMRYASVLGRIGLAWMFAALITLHTAPRTRIVIVAAILIGYWLLLRFIPAPDAVGAGCFSEEGWLGGYIDRQLLPGRLHRTIHDPEGILSTIPAIATALLGILTGEFIRSGKNTPIRRILILAAYGIGLVIAGKLWDIAFPINKNMWSSSFVCFVGGLSMLLFVLFYYIIDIKGIRGWTPFFTVIGLNSITIYLVQQIVDMNRVTVFFFGGVTGLVPEAWQPLIGGIGYVLVCWLLLWFLYRHRIFLKV